MPKNLEQLVDEVLNKLCEQDFYRFKSGNDLALELAREDMVTFLEAQIRLAYREGAEAMGDAIRNIDISDPSLKTAMLDKVLGKAEAFLDTLNPPHL